MPISEWRKQRMPFAKRPDSPKLNPTFRGALALVGKELWAQEATFYRSPREADMVKVPRALVECLTETLCYTA